MLEGVSTLAPTKMRRDSALATLPAALASAEEVCEMAEQLEARGKGARLEDIRCEGTQEGRVLELLWEAAGGVASGLPAS